MTKTLDQGPAATALQPELLSGAKKRVAGRYYGEIKNSKGGPGLEVPFSRCLLPETGHSQRCYRMSMGRGHLYTGLAQFFADPSGCLPNPASLAPFWRPKTSDLRRIDPTGCPSLHVCYAPSWMTQWRFYCSDHVSPANC